MGYLSLWADSDRIREIGIIVFEGTLSWNSGFILKFAVRQRIILFIFVLDLKGHIIMLRFYEVRNRAVWLDMQSNFWKINLDVIKLERYLVCGQN